MTNQENSTANNLKNNPLSSQQSGPADSQQNNPANSQKKNPMNSQQKTKEEELDEFQVCQGVKTGAATVAGVGLGLIAGVAGIAAAAVIEIVLPVSLCLWATGVSGGAIGLLLGMGSKKNC